MNTQLRSRRGAAALALAFATALALALVLTVARAAFADPTLSEFSTGGQPQQIVAGPDGALWFTSALPANDIGRITTSGTVVNYGIPTANSFPQGITAGPDGNLWFTEQSAGQIGVITPGGTVTEYPIPSGGFPTAITAGPDGAVWFTEFNADKIGRITTGGTITEYPIPTANSFPVHITVGPDNALWFAERGANKIGRVTTLGAFTEYATPTADSAPNGITSGPDGAVWFTELGSSQIGRITTSGAITEYPTPSSTYPEGIASGPDGNLWYTDAFGNVGRFELPGFSVAGNGLNFGSQPLATTSQPMTVTVTNPGPGGPLAISGVSVAGANPGDFSITSDTCSGQNLAPHATCTVGVSFTPSAVGPRSASLVLTDNALNSPQSVSLNGSGAPSADVGISLGASPNPVKVNNNLTYTITVTNFGPTGATGVSVTDVLPATVQYRKKSLTQGSCNTPAVGASGTVNCSLGTLASGATATITLIVNVVTTAKATITNTAVEASGSYDPNASNSSATVTTNVFGRH